MVAAAGSERKLRLVRSLGAAAAVDYTASGWAQAVRRAVGADGVAVVFDSVGGEVGREAFDLLAAGGRFAVYGFASGLVKDATVAEILRKGVTAVGFGGQGTRASRRPRS